MMLRTSPDAAWRRMPSPRRPPHDHVVGLLQVAQHVLGYQPSLNVIRMLEPLPAIVVEGEREAEQHLLVRGVRKA